MLDKIFMVLLLAVPAVAVGDWLAFPPSVMMTLACLGILPIAKYMGQATEQLSHKTGPQWGGLITATFGNMCELVIALMALRAGLIDVVKASITGSIIGNILLVLGASMFFGGLKHETQRFNARSAGHASTMLLIVAGALMLPAAVHHIPNVDTALVDGKISLVISAVLILLYFGGMYFSLKTHKHQFTPVAAAEKSKHDAEVEHEATWSPWKSIAVLVAATGTVVFLSHHLVEHVEHVAHTMGMSSVFVGVILLAIIGNAAENSSAILMARKNKMDLSLNIVLGSSTQIAMFVAPVVVLAGFFVFGQPMNLAFSEAEIIAVIFSVFVLSRVVADGECDWYEGLLLLGVYVILGVTFYFIPEASTAVGGAIGAGGH